MARTVLGVPVERQVGQDDAEAVGEVLYHRLPLAVREAGRVQEGEGRTGPRLPVGHPRPVRVVVEAQLHPRRSPATSPRR